MRDESFKNYILDQLVNMEDLRSKGMFGGFGLYQGEFFFGIVDKDRLYFKINEETKQRYQAHDMEPFKCSPKIIESQDELLQWAEQAVNAQSKK